ncbi:unnamed protein product [Adineta steineri]|uniref:Uncharacterized protein n=1 Tax=Adineta steineri TaxID=433720 RepID=A0A814NJK9_9BILA|nr:unnamed protein product [Adineta steineri]
MQSWLIPPIPPTGNNQRIELAGLDLWISHCINDVFVYPADLDIDRLKQALSRTLSLWPLIAGRFLLINDEHYIIEMSDNGIPLSFVENTELTQWPLNLNVVLDAAEDRLTKFIDKVSTAKLLRGSLDEPLLRIKITRLVQSGEWIMGTSWAHVLGDAFAYMKFLNTFSRFYQQLEPLEPSPIFERRLWNRENADQSVLRFLKHLTDGVSAKQNFEKAMRDQTTHDQINIHFSGEELAQLHKLAGNVMLTIQDVMTAYVILTLNTHCFENNEQIIQHTNTIVNYRGVVDSIASPGLMANCSLKMVSENFEDPYCLSSIAKSIRHSIIRSRDSSFLYSLLATADGLMRNLARDDLELNTDHIPHGCLNNSNYRYDWADLVDFGYTNKCRFHTEGTAPLFLRIFRLNPVFDGTHWMERDRKGAEIAFRIEKSMKQKFIDAWQRDIKENFIQVKQ